MIVYNKLGTLLQSRGMTWSDLRESGIAANTPFKFSTNKGVTVDSIDKVRSEEHTSELQSQR